MSEEYWWEDAAGRSELWANIFYSEIKIGYLTQCEDDPESWYYTRCYFGFRGGTADAETLEEAKEDFMDSLRQHFEDKIGYYKEMLQLFKTTYEEGNPEWENG